MHEAVLENGFAEDGIALGGGQQRHQLRLHICREMGEGRGGDIQRFQWLAGVAADEDAVVALVDADADMFEVIDHHAQCFGAGVE